MITTRPIGNDWLKRARLRVNQEFFTSKADEEFLQ
jgi:hypothetical protein